MCYTLHCAFIIAQNRYPNEKKIGIKGNEHDFKIQISLLPVTQIPFNLVGVLIFRWFQQQDTACIRSCPYSSVFCFFFFITFLHLPRQLATVEFLEPLKTIQRRGSFIFFSFILLFASPWPMQVYVWFLGTILHFTANQQLCICFIFTLSLYLSLSFPPLNPHRLMSSLEKNLVAFARICTSSSTLLELSHCEKGEEEGQVEKYGRMWKGRKKGVRVKIKLGTLESEFLCHGNLFYPLMSLLFVILNKELNILWIPDNFR